MNLEWTTAYAKQYQTPQHEQDLILSAKAKQIVASSNCTANLSEAIQLLHNAILANRYLEGDYLNEIGLIYEAAGDWEASTHFFRL